MSKERNYAVLSPMLRNGEKYQPGDTVRMPPEEAERLVAAGVLAEAQPLPEEDAGDAEADAPAEDAGQADAQPAQAEDADQTAEADAAQQGKPKKGGRKK